ncbi:response regulator transcription factor [Lentilactobacillus sp. IMAU92037]|uniref:response regulator transcription factor n=1 Tax=Lentilactobacillus TaxID=2767893 RepID=UPI001C278CB1|nr:MULTISPECIES: response regulator transcription factor [Lentilactobacillus]MBU9790250.1 response regulator transcription factor [Lentilactobacillus dabitei]MBV0930352.1 response regulator transcription factor [Lentilactobacillus dabitei]MDM7517133.1 response regulator transcription factor [Lentilactobacillus sp. TOM.63]
MTIRITLAEDQSLLSSALAQLLDLEDDLEVIGTYGDGEEAFKHIKYEKPDVAILDIEMPKKTGLTVAEEIDQQKLPVKTIILTTFANKNYFQTAVGAYVDGYLLKDIPSDDLIQSIHEVMAGKTIYSPELVSSILGDVDNPLSDKETQILAEIRKGSSTAEIAKALFLSNGTVRNYISSILSKLGAANRIEALNIAEKRKWL